MATHLSEFTRTEGVVTRDGGVEGTVLFVTATGQPAPRGRLPVV